MNTHFQPFEPGKHPRLKIEIQFDKYIIFDKIIKLRFKLQSIELMGQ